MKRVERNLTSFVTTITVVSLLSTGCRKDEPLKQILQKEDPQPAPARVETPVPPSTPVPEPRKAAPPAETAVALDLQTFMTAAHDGKLDVIGSALKAGNDANETGEDGRTALMLAAFNGHARVAELLIDAGANVKARDSIRRTALMYACTGPDVPTIELLIKHGASVNAVDGHERWTPLMFAGAEGHVEVIRTLLKHGANATMKDVDGETARMFAANNGHQTVAELLRKAEESGGKN